MKWRMKSMIKHVVLSLLQWAYKPRARLARNEHKKDLNDTYGQGIPGFRCT